MERRIKENTHPGEILIVEIIDGCKLTIDQAAERLKVTSDTLSNIINCKAAILPDMAIRIAEVFGGSAEIWLRLQNSYDSRVAEK